MQVFDYFFKITFAAIGAFALVAAFFMGAWWHLGTAAVCIFIVIMLKKEMK
jgi:hypothetical protein